VEGRGGCRQGEGKEEGEWRRRRENEMMEEWGGCQKVRNGKGR